MAVSGTTMAANARQLCDTLGNVVTDAQFLIWLNLGIKELHKLVATAFTDRFGSSESFTLTSSNTRTLPATFMFMRGLDYNPGTANRETVHRFNWGDRNNILGSSGLLSRRRYRVLNSTTLVIEPEEDYAGAYKLWYVAQPTLLTTLSDNLPTDLEPWQEYVETAAAKKAMDKQEYDSRHLAARLLEMREDIKSEAVTDENEADTITDVEPFGGRPWYR